MPGTQPTTNGAPPVVAVPPGWPTSGFSQSSSIPHKWNSWIIYPIIGLSLFVAIDWVQTYRHRPITEDQIRREMDRLRGAH
jgi:hypothetical protein